MIRINGKETTLNGSVTLAQYLKEHNYQTSRIAVELNGDIVPKSRYGETALRDGDTLEVVSFVGGG